MKCLVSGATGFIGRHLCQQLAIHGDSVTALSRSGGALADGTSTVPLDLAAPGLDGKRLAGVDVVFHLAGIAHRQADESAYRQLNYLATLRLARLAAQQGVKCFLFLSSVKAMGPPDSTEKRSEDDCSTPQSPYGLSKWQAECALREEFADNAMSVVILRPTLVYGPQAKGNLGLLARAVKRGLPRPPQEGSRSMLAVQDLVDLMRRIAASPPPGVHTWIACDDNGYSARYIYDLLRDALGRSRGAAWLPRWGWRLGAALMDLAAARPGESTFSRLFGTELYSNAAVSVAMDWHPPGRLEDTVAQMSPVAGSRAP